jgi:ABC-2 type transport system ATP-binding protein
MAWGEIVIAWRIVRLLQQRRAGKTPMARSASPARQPPAAAIRHETVIDAHDLVKTYGSLTAVDRVSFSVQRGEIFGLLGPNGAGKTTTLEMLEGLRTPDEGDADVLGESVVRTPRTVKERIGVQLQATALPPKTTVTESIDLFGAFYQRRRPTEELLAEFDLTEKSSAMADSLSGGQAQRLSIALALVNDPDLVFLDEPTTGLDPQARLNLWDVIEGIRGGGKTVVITTHYMEEAERLCDRVAVIDRGRIVALDTPERLIATYAPGTSIEFDTSVGDDGTLQRVPGVDGVEVEGERVVLHTSTPEGTLAGLFDPAAAWAQSVGAMRDLRVRGGTLEDVFITLTGRTLRS